MRPIEAYKTSDGQYFEDARAAKKHQLDIVGERLDELLPHDDRGNVTSTDRFNLLMKMMDDPLLLDKIDNIQRALECLND